MTTFPPETTAAPARRPQSTIARNWLKTLWPASYKGVPFFVEQDNEDGSRRIVEHEFPMRDFPFLEDLGEGVRHYEVTAYVASDAADGDAASVIAICATRGPGTLVLPTHGPLIVRCLTFKRDRKKDKHGYIGLELKFTREGFASALVSIASLANTCFVTAEATALSAALSFARTTVTGSVPRTTTVTTATAIASQPDYVVEAAVSGVQDNAATLEAIRTSAPVDPATSATQRVEIQSIFNAADTIADAPPVVGAGVFSTQAGQDSNSPAVDVAARLLASSRALGKGMPPDQAIVQFEEVFLTSQVVVPAPVYVTEGTLQEAANKETAYRLMRMAALICYSEAIARVKLADRPSAITLRANVSEYFESELLAINADEIELAHAIMKLRDSVIDYLSRAVLDLAPVIVVETNLVMPSLFFAWRLYQDPDRSTELAARNRVSHPSFMPLEFEALAR